jgi:hypothetical protein
MELDGGWDGFWKEFSPSLYTFRPSYWHQLFRNTPRVTLEHVHTARHFPIVRAIGQHSLDSDCVADAQFEIVRFDVTLSLRLFTPGEARRMVGRFDVIPQTIPHNPKQGKPYQASRLPVLAPLWQSQITDCASQPNQVTPERFRLQLSRPPLGGTQGRISNHCWVSFRKQGRVIGWLAMLTIYSWLLVNMNHRQNRLSSALRREFKHRHEWATRNVIQMPHSKLQLTATLH